MISSWSFPIILLSFCIGVMGLEISNDPQSIPCERGSYRCQGGGCIPNQMRCDGKNDCFFGDDESQCSHLVDGCRPTEGVCKNGVCIPSHWICDGEFDCVDHSDEGNCPVENQPLTTTPKSSNKPKISTTTKTTTTEIDETQKTSTTHSTTASNEIRYPVVEIIEKECKPGLFSVEITRLTVILLFLTQSIILLFLLWGIKKICYRKQMKSANGVAPKKTEKSILDIKTVA